MDLAPKQARTENGTDCGTVEQRLRFFMQDVTGRALVMMESATQGQQGIAMDLVQEAFIHYINLMQIKIPKNGTPCSIQF